VRTVSVVDVSEVELPVVGKLKGEVFVTRAHEFG